MNVVQTNIADRASRKNSCACRLRFGRFVAMRSLLINSGLWTIVTVVPGWNRSAKP
jgi:hypothetical protein